MDLEDMNFSLKIGFIIGYVFIKSRKFFCQVVLYHHIISYYLYHIITSLYKINYIKL